MAGPLAGIRIIDISERSPSAAIAGMVLSDYGAEVIRAEPEGGDPVRDLDAAKIWLRGQKSVIIGPEQVQDGSWARLRASADVLIDTVQPWTAKLGGLLDGPDAPWQVRGILTALPASPAVAKSQRPWGALPAYGELLEAKYGFMHMQAGCREGPIFIGWPHATYGAAAMLQIGVLGALFERGRTGYGQVVTTSLLDGMAILAVSQWMGGEHLERPVLTTNRPRGTARHFNALFECGDGGWIQIHTGPRGAFDRLMKLIGRDDLVQEGLSPQALRQLQLEPAVADELWSYVQKTFKTRSTWEWTEALNKADVCCLPALPPGDALWLEQTMANGLVDVTPDGGRRLGLVAKFQRTPAQAGRTMPAPGEHTASLLAQAAQPKAWTAQRRGTNGAATERVGPLDGVLVLDFGAWLAGPFSPRLMADLGARVIKIEETVGEMGRASLRSFLAVQRGKEGLAVDLKTEEGRKIVYDLVKKADVVHHNMRLPAAERLGIGYEALREMNPKLIYCHSSGYGDDGPWAAWPAFEWLHSAVTGVLHRTAGRGNRPSQYISQQDYGCGLTSTVAVLAALVERERSGQGQYLEVPQIAAGLLAMSDVHFEGGRKSETFALDHEQRGYAPTNALYRTRDGWIVIACYSDQEWQGVRRGLGIETILWPDYGEARRDEVGSTDSARAVEEALAEMTTSEAEERLRSEGVPRAVPAPVDLERLVSDSTFRGLGLVVIEHHPEAGEVYQVGHTVRFGNSTRLQGRPSPVLGQNTVDILHEVGRSDEEITALLAERTISAVTG